MWREEIKHRLQQEKRQWEEQQPQDAHSSLHFFSVGRLLVQVEAALIKETTHNVSASEEFLSRYSINRHELHSNYDADTKASGTSVQQVAFSSTHMWLTGFLRFRDDKPANHGMYLCDASRHIHAILLDPWPKYIDQLVLVKRWMLVVKYTGSGALVDTFLEVHEDPAILAHGEQHHIEIGVSRVPSLLTTHYLTQDPPLYSGSCPWSMALASATETVSTSTIEAASVDRKQKKHRIHVVFGRVVCLSPIAQHQDQASCHFFVEIEHQDRTNNAQSIVNIMFVGSHAMRWHLFLQPGRFALITDLVKVFSQECGVFILQTTQLIIASQTGLQLQTEVIVWDDFPLDFKYVPVLPPMYNDSVKLVPGCVISYEGSITRLLWDECIEIDGDSGALVSLFHFPFTHELMQLRVGTTIRIVLAHIVRLPNPIDARLILALCSRSHVSVVQHTNVSTSCTLISSRSYQRRSRKKWSQLGDFHRQPISLSMYLLELFRALSKKFYFGIDALSASRMSVYLSFPNVGKCEAVRHIANSLGIELESSRCNPSTLGSLFLNSHSNGDYRCPSIRCSDVEGSLNSYHIATIEELVVFGELKAKTEIKRARERVESQSVLIKISREDLEWCALVGCIRGNISSGDLEIYDRTGCMPLTLSDDTNHNISHGVDLDRVVVIRQFELLIEYYSELQVKDQGRTSLLFSIRCSVANLKHISMSVSKHDGQVIHSPRKSLEAKEDLIVLVTHVDPLPISTLNSRGYIPRSQYRCIHGIVLPVDRDVFTAVGQNSIHVAEFLVNTECTHWFVEQYSCYRFQGVEHDGNITQKSGITSCGSVDKAAFDAIIEFCRSQHLNNGKGYFCLKQGVKVAKSIAGQLVQQPSQVYRLERDSSILPLVFKITKMTLPRCMLHDSCQQPDHDSSGCISLLEEASRKQNGTTTLNAYSYSTYLHLERKKLAISYSSLVATSLILYAVQEMERVIQVRDLLIHQLYSDSPTADEDAGRRSFDEIQTDRVRCDPAIHKGSLMSVVGVIVAKKYYARASARISAVMVGDTHIGEKRSYDQIDEELQKNTVNRQLVCSYQVRDLCSLDVIDVQIDISRYGFRPSLQLNTIAVFSKLHACIVRSSYRAYLNWTHCSAIRVVRHSFQLTVCSSSELYTSMKTTFLNELYHSRFIDRTLRRFVVRVIHVNYLFLKRKCRKCHRPLQLNKDRGVWLHAGNPASSSNTRQCTWQQLHCTDSTVASETYMSTTLRCIIDDGSGQAELFLENEVAWELLPCSSGERRRFDEILQLRTAELSYFAGQSENRFFTRSDVLTDNNYYQNELHAMAVKIVKVLRPMTVFARRFYNSTNDRQGSNGVEATSVLTFDKNTSIAVKTVPFIQLEARRVDVLHIKSELCQRLEQLKRLRASE